MTRRFSSPVVAWSAYRPRCFWRSRASAPPLIERLRGVSALPRAAHFHLRTLELFRIAGIEDEVRAQSEKEFMPEGAIVALQ